MIDDDDPKSTGPAPSAPADDKAVEPTEPEGEQPESEDDAETKAPTDEQDVGEDDEQDDDEGEEDDGDDDGEQPKRRQRPTRAERYREQAERLKGEIQELRNRQGGSLPHDQALIQREFERRVYEEIGDPPNPNDPKYKDNYVQLDREISAWENDRRQVVRQVRKELLGDIQREQGRLTGLVADHKERVSRLRTKVKDFDQTMAKATAPVARHVERLILESNRSDRVMWHLARDQAKLVKLNNMAPEAVAREIGKIEGRLSLPQPKQQTKARKPITPLRGGGAAPPSGLAAVNAYIKKQYGDR